MRRYFVLYILLLCLLLGTVLAMTCYLVVTSILGGDYFTSYLAEIFIGCLAGCFFFGVLQLIISHIVLMCQGRTTN